MSLTPSIEPELSLAETLKLMRHGSMWRLERQEAPFEFWSAASEIDPVGEPEALRLRQPVDGFSASISPRTLTHPRYMQPPRRFYSPLPGDLDLFDDLPLD